MFKKFDETKDPMYEACRESKDTSRVSR